MPTNEHGTVFLLVGPADPTARIEGLLREAGLGVELVSSPSRAADVCASDGPGCVVVCLGRLEHDRLGVRALVAAKGRLRALVLVTDDPAFAGLLETVHGAGVEVVAWPAPASGVLAAVRRALAQDLARHELGHRFARLTRREREVMRLLCAGRDRQEIAQRLGIRLRTVEFYQCGVMRKMRATDLTDLMRMGAVLRLADLC